MAEIETTKENELITKQIKKAAASLIQEKSYIKDLVGFYEKIFILQHEKDPGIQKDYSFLKDSKVFPLVKREDFEVDIEMAEELFKNICDVCAGSPMKPDPSAIVIKNSLNASDISFESTVKSYLKDDSPTPQYSTEPKQGFNPHLYDFILHNSIKPSIVKNSKMISGYVTKTSSLEDGRCPVCKSAPAISLVSGKTASRSLVCSFCWHEYKIKKSVCPFCKNNNNKTLGNISLDTDKGIRADYCNNCKKYIKTIYLKDYRKDIYLPLELIASMPFDMKMNEEGFKPE